ncbi:MAG: 1-acyl-sn-glycerol-3-phosphate acyltransferase [Clostridia bacterium]|nr:1-acyl-sn-glycerol-3-phosphate acyltransferase [Clostridia bacterium]MBO5206345.1 1-acyl-sn-glycerol-3-phosphate acyltransferase [Clostridia bacterium]
MKIKVIDKSFDEVMALKKEKRVKPHKPDIFFRTLMKVVAAPDLKKSHFTFEKEGMERLGKREPALFLMNHSSFIDLEIVASMLYPRPFNIVATGDAFIGKSLLMHLIGCIPTNKFVIDTALVRNMLHATRKQKSSIVMFPEAGYSFDGTSTTLPETLGKLIKMLGVPVVMIRTEGAFARDPLYNNLQVRSSVTVTAKEKFLLSKEDIQNMSDAEIFEVVTREFSFDNFAWQRDNRIRIDEPFRADYLNRVLYKCPSCLAEGKTRGSGTELTCFACGKKYSLDEYGSLKAEEGSTEFEHIPDWYSWERLSVRAELLAGVYKLDVPVEIFMTVNNKHVYRVGGGRLRHDEDGFVLDGCDGKLHYEQKPLSSYSINSDFNWYEIGDVICIGNNEHLFYCFPKAEGDIVAKTRLAAEELYKIVKARRDAAKKVARV